MPQVKISGLPAGEPKGTDITPATDTQDLSEAPSGTTKKYTRWSEFNFYMYAQGFEPKESVLNATDVELIANYTNGISGVGATLTSNGVQLPIKIDGDFLEIGDRVLVKNQTTKLQNGIYVVTDKGSASTDWILTRSTDYNTSSDISSYDVVLCINGATNAGKAFRQTQNNVTIGTSDINFIPLSVDSSDFNWISTSDTNVQTMPNNGYILTSATLCTIALPTSAKIGDEISIIGSGAGLFKITQASNQKINMGNISTTTGVTGQLLSTLQNDVINLICIDDNSFVFNVFTGSQGTFDLL
jgi:hypothetical protein